MATAEEQVKNRDIALRLVAIADELTRGLSTTGDDPAETHRVDDLTYDTFEAFEALGTFDNRKAINLALSVIGRTAGQGHTAA